MEITVKIELGTKERKLVEELIARLGELGRGCTCSCENVTLPQSIPVKAEPQPEPMKDPTSEPMPETEDAFAQEPPQTAEPTPEQWRARIREIMQQFVITDKRDAIKKLLERYGVPKASALPEDKLQPFCTELCGVCGA